MVARRYLEGLDDPPRVKGRARERPEHPKKSLVEAVEGPRLERVRRENADDPVALHERTPQARVHIARGVRVDEQQAVVRISQRAVGGKANRRLPSHDDVQARMLPAGEAPAEHLRRQTVRG